MDAEERELARGRKAMLGRRPDAPVAPEWTEPAPGGVQTPDYTAKRLTLWLEDRGVNMGKVLVVQAGDRFAAVTATESET